MPVLEYAFLQHFYIESKDRYEELLCECINRSSKFKERCGGKFVRVFQQSHGECDAIIPSTHYGIDFKLMISASLAEFRNLSKPHVTEIAKGVKAFSNGKEIKQNAVLFPNAFRNMTDKQFLQYKTGSDPVSKAVTYFFEKVLDTPKNLLLFLPLYVTTIDKTFSYDKQLET